MCLAVLAVLGPPDAALAQPAAGEKPAAPEFSAERLGGGTLGSKELAGRPAVLIFFLHTCPHCHHALASMKKDLAALPEATRPRLIGISLTDRAAEVRAELAERNLDFFEVVFDPDHDMRNAFGATAGTPDIFLIDADGRIAGRAGRSNTDGMCRQGSPCDDLIRR